MRVGEALEKIPAFPPIAIRVLQMASNENVAFSKLKETIQLDPSLAAEVLRRANSPLFGFNATIGSLYHALAMLGVDRIKDLAVTIATKRFLRGALIMEELRTCWYHCIATALLSKRIAGLCYLPRDQAYVGGLLHDVGRMGLMSAYPAEYANMIAIATARAAAGEHFDLSVYERELFGIDSHEASRHLMEKWNLPPELKVLTEGSPAEDEGGGAGGLREAVALACPLAHQLGFGLLPCSREAEVAARMEFLPQQARERLLEELPSAKAEIETQIAMLEPESAAATSLGAGYFNAGSLLREDPEESVPADISETARAQGAASWLLYVTVGFAGTAVFTALMLLAFD